MRALRKNTKPIGASITTHFSGVPKIGPQIAGEEATNHRDQAGDRQPQSHVVVDREHVLTQADIDLRRPVREPARDPWAGAERHRCCSLYGWWT